jgi:hypothetical protein
MICPVITAHLRVAKHEDQFRIVETCVDDFDGARIKL